MKRNSFESNESTQSYKFIGLSDIVEANFVSSRETSGIKVFLKYVSLSFVNVVPMVWTLFSINRSTTYPEWQLTITHYPSDTT